MVKKMFVSEGPGAGLVDRPVRISSLVSFTGEKRRLTDADLHKLTRALLRSAMGSAPVGERPVAPDEEDAVAPALARTLMHLGELEMDDVQAVQMGPQALLQALKAAGPDATRDLSADAAQLHDALLATACVHILHFFTQRSTFVARTLVEHSSRRPGRGHFLAGRPPQPAPTARSVAPAGHERGVAPWQGATRVVRT
nr:hypothetical protein [Streptomyces sp. HUAS 15-9]